MESNELKNPSPSTENEVQTSSIPENVETNLTVDYIQEKTDTEEELIAEHVESSESSESSISKNDESSVDETLVPPETEISQLMHESILSDAVEEEEDPFHDEDSNAEGEPIHDYSSYNKINLINTLRKIIAEGDVDHIKPHADAIKSCFYKIRNTEVAEKKASFIAIGNDESLFDTEPDPYEQELKDLFREYKNLRYESNKKLEAVKEENYIKKCEIIEEIKSLVNGDNSLNNSFQIFNELQNKFRGLGQVPQAKVKDLWENYHYQVERFYDFVKIDRELRDLDLKRNLDQKIILCSKAEELASKDDEPLLTFRELQKLHESWREIGPVPRDHKQELWDRFKTATAVINKRYQHHFELERSAQKEQFQKKIELCEQAEELSSFTSDNPREWNDVNERVIQLQEEWKKIGFGPRKENAKIWERFRIANDKFFHNKRDFWNKSKDDMLKNMSIKIDICEQAERLKDSEDWKATTDRLITLQKKWKEVGPVPRKQSELIWKRFRTACDEFFNHKQTHFSGVSDNQDENLKAKKGLIAEIESFQSSGSPKDDLIALKNFQEKWASIGHVPFRKKEELINKYHEVIDNQFNKIKMDDQDLNIIKFKSKIEHLASVPRGWSKINIERDKYSSRLRQLESEINTLINNVGFFGTSEGAQSLVQGVNSQIEKIKIQIIQLKAKMRIIDDQEEIN